MQTYGNMFSKNKLVAFFSKKKKGSTGKTPRAKASEAEAPEAWAPPLPPAPQY